MVLDRTLDIRDGAVRFRVLSGGRGPHLVYFHSFHERGGWSPFLDHLAARYTVLAPFHPGVQGSSGVETLDDVLDLVLAYDELLDRLGIGAAHLVGHFFGGMVAAELAATLRPRAAKLVLISPLGLWRDDAPSEDLLILPHEDLPAVLFRDPASEVARGWATLPAGEEQNIAAQIESIQRRAAMAKFVWPIPDRGLKKRLHRITAPTLVLWGEADRANPLVYAEEWQRRVKGAALSLLPGGHMVLHEVPDAAMSNAVCPGAIATDLRANSTRILGTDAPEMRGIGGDEAAVRAITPAGRRGTLQEVAAAACYLAGEEAAYVTGQTLVIDGGWTAR